MAASDSFVLTSESVTEGHPDKVCDYIADTILDFHMAADPHARVACEVMAKSNRVILAGEITSTHTLDHESLVREAVRQVGYTDPAEPFSADTLIVQSLITQQSGDIARGVDRATDQGAGDQGIMFGYATDETPELMPLPILLAHRIAEELARDRKGGRRSWLRPDGKTQVSVRYEGRRPVSVTDVLVSTQHSDGVEPEEIHAYVAADLLPRALGQWFSDEIRVRTNPTGSFRLGGPAVDCGLTGRKTIVDSYGGAARHGGGAFSGKDPSKVDRSAAYFCRYVARQVVTYGLASRVEIQVSYAIGIAHPISISVDTFNTGNQRAAEAFVRGFDFRPAAIIERLGLLRPIYRTTTNYGHFGRPGLPWEK